MIRKRAFKDAVSADILHLICIYKGLKMTGLGISISQVRAVRYRAQE